MTYDDLAWMQKEAGLNFNCILKLYVRMKNSLCFGAHHNETELPLKGS